MYIKKESKARKIQKDEDSNSVFINIFRTNEDDGGVYDVREILCTLQFHILINRWTFLIHKVVLLE